MGVIVGNMGVIVGLGILEGAFANVEGFRRGFPVTSGGGEEMFEGLGSVLLRTMFERRGGESVDDCGMPLGFSIDVGVLGFNEGGLRFVDCLVTVVVIPDDKP